MTGRNDLGVRLREWRERRKLTQAELAGDSSISTRHLSFVETGRSRYTHRSHTVAATAAALHAQRALARSPTFDASRCTV